MSVVQFYHCDLCALETSEELVDEWRYVGPANLVVKRPDSISGGGTYSHYFEHVCSTCATDLIRTLAKFIDERRDKRANQVRAE